jgi:ankyrin repeat protein
MDMAKRRSRDRTRRPISCLPVCYLLVLVMVMASVGLSAQAPDLRLIDAVRAERSAAAEALLAETDVNATQADGATALHWAAYLNNETMATKLVAAGAEPGATNDLGVTPLTLACENANPAVVELLLRAGADPKAALGTGETVLMSCARTGNASAVRALLMAGADVNAREQAEDQTALMWAAAQPYPAIVGLLIDAGAEVAARSRERRQVISRRLQSELKYGELGRNYGTDAEETRVGGFTPLLFAVRQGDVESARLLLEAGADVNDRAPDGASALVVAAHSGHGNLARFLLEQGANPDAAAAGYTALHAAVLTGDVALIEALLAHGARPNAQVTLATKVTRNGQVLMIGEHLLGATPFALAAKFTEVEIMQALVAGGADARLPLKNGWTPLMLAAGASWRYAVWDRRDRALAKSPAFQAQMYDGVRTLAAVTLVADQGVDLDAVDGDGSTALHHVVDKGFDTVVGLLIDRGADLAVANRRGETPLAIVARGRTGNVQAAPATADLLRSRGAS